MCFLESIQIHNLRECSLFRNMRDCRVHHSIPFRRDIDGYAFLYFISHKLILVIRLQSYTIYLDEPNVSVRKLKQIRMRAGIEQQQCQFVVVLLPKHQPVWLNVALPYPCISAREDMWLIFLRKAALFT